ncbi:MAG: ATP-binding cassette domain-containing protein [bacterium]
MRDIIIECRKVRKSFGDILALDGVDVEVRRGEFIAIVGPSGCGKSTLLRIIGGLLAPTEGEVWIEGRRVFGEQEVGFVFQDPILLPWRTVERNIYLPFEISSPNGDVGFSRTRDSIELIGLKGFEKAYPYQLSGGMKQRVAVARALVHDSDIILMDEPFGALDAMTRERMDVELHSLWEKTGKTILFVTHSISEAVFLANRVFIMSERPGHIKDIVEISLPRRRDYHTWDAEGEKIVHSSAIIRNSMEAASSRIGAPPAADRERREGLKGFFKENFQRLLVPVGLAFGVALWKGILRIASYPEYILPDPGTVWQRFLNYASAGNLWTHIWATFQESLLGFLLGLGVAAILGYVLAKVRFLEKLISPYIVASQSIPIVALAPLIILWFGFGVLSKILISALIVFFPILVNVIVGIREADERMLELMRSLKATQWQILRKVEIPAALPVIFGGMRVGITFSLIGAVVGEFISANRGLGYLVNLSRGILDTPLLFVSLLILSAMGMALYFSIYLLETLLFSWKGEEYRR